MSTPRGVPLTVTPGGGEGGWPVPARQASPSPPAERTRRATPVIDLIPVIGVQPPAVARVLPLEPVAAVRIERPSERARRTAGVLQALAAYLRAAEGDRPGREPGR